MTKLISSACIVSLALIGGGCGKHDQSAERSSELVIPKQIFANCADGAPKRIEVPVRNDLSYTVKIRVETSCGCVSVLPETSSSLPKGSLGTFILSVSAPPFGVSKVRLAAKTSPLNSSGPDKIFESHVICWNAPRDGILIPPLVQLGAPYLEGSAGSTAEFLIQGDLNVLKRLRILSVLPAGCDTKMDEPASTAEEAALKIGHRGVRISLTAKTLEQGRFARIDIGTDGEETFPVRITWARPVSSVTTQSTGINEYK
jgi:hypothetical protein